MKTAYIGQRVRIVGSDTLPHLIGKEGTVLSVPQNLTNSNGEAWLGVLVDVDGMGNMMKHGDGWFRFAPRLDHLEPLTYPDQFTPLKEISIINPDGTYNPAGDVPLTVVNEEELHA